LIKTMAMGPVKVEKILEEENRDKIDGRRNTMEMVVQGDYAFISSNIEVLDNLFPDPAVHTRALCSKYDVFASANLKGVPKGIKDVFLDFLRASIETELQQRDDEPEGRYRIRKAQGMDMLDDIERLFVDGEELTIGWNV